MAAEAAKAKTAAKMETEAEISGRRDNSRRAKRRISRAYLSPLYYFAWLGPVLLLLVIWMTLPSFVTRLQDQLFDLFQRAAPRTIDTALPVVIVDIDDRSIARLGQWPWPRTQIAELVGRLRKAKAASIGFDIVFSEPDRTSAEAFLARLPEGARKVGVRKALEGTPTNDSVLAGAIGAAPVVLGLVLTHGGELPSFVAPYGLATAGDDPRAFVSRFSGGVMPIPALDDQATGLGALNWLPDGDQVVRRVPLLLVVGDRLVPSFALESLRVAQGASTLVVRSWNASGAAIGAVRGVESIQVGTLTATTAPGGDIRPRFTPHRAERFVSAWKMLDGTVDPAKIEGRIVLIGSSSAGLTDIRATPVDPAMPGVEVQAQVIESLMAQTQLVRPSWSVLELYCGALLALGLAAILPLIPSLAGTTVAAVGIGALFAASWWSFLDRQLLLDPIMPSAMLLVTYLGSLSILFHIEQHDRRFVQEAFGRFVSPDVVASLARNPGRLTLGGELRPLTVMFTDVRNFSTIAEHMSAQDLTRFMNAYLSPMSEIVLGHRGTVDKYIGDAIMAFWNAPLEDRNHALHAAHAALAMVAAIPSLQSELAANIVANLPPIRCGIGLASGPCVVGNLGSRLRCDYSALGDDVNLASRLEGLTKLYGIDILATEATREAAPDLAWIEIDTVVVKGRGASTRIFALVGDETFARTNAFNTFGDAHAKMLAAYRDGRLHEAEAVIVDLRKQAPVGFSKLYDLFVERCSSVVTPHAAGASAAADATLFARQALINSNV